MSITPDQLIAFAIAVSPGLLVFLAIALTGER